MKKILLFTVFLILSINLTGKLLDLESERVIEQIYHRDKDGVILGKSEKKHINNHKNAIIFIHGFLSSPKIFEHSFNEFKRKNIFDIYVPRLPFHGKNLQEASKFNNEEIIDYMSKYINKKSSKYKKLTVVAFSYAASNVIAMDKMKKIPENVEIVLLSPSIFIKSNSKINKKLLSVYHPLFRKYCNYELLGCKNVGYESGDKYAKDFLIKEQPLSYIVVPALKELFKIDTENRSHLKNISKPFNIIMSQDDNQVNFKDIEHSCSKNKNCNMTSFATGKHLFMVGEHKNEYLKKIEAIAKK